MRKVIFILIAAVTLYFAGMYKSLSLMVMFFAELVLCLVMFAISIVLSRKIEACFLNDISGAVVNTPQGIRISVKNNSIIPINKAKIKLKFKYSDGKKKVKKLYFSAAPRSTEVISFFVTAPCCGLLNMKLTKVYAYDLLSLFSFPKRAKSVLGLNILPNTLPISINNTSMLSPESAYDLELSYDTSGYSSEIRHLREYRDGDQIKHIHWNQTARTQQVYVKEFEQESGGSIAVYVLLVTRDKITLPRKSAFYETLYAVILGLLTKFSSIKLFTRNYNNNMDIGFTVKNTDELNEAFFEIYKIPVKKLKKKDSKPEILSTGALSFDFDLSLKCDGKLLFKFSEKDHTEQIALNSFDISFGS